MTNTKGGATEKVWEPLA